MKFNVLVTGGLYSSQAGYSAWRFCRAALAAGHTVSQVFFYQDGVSQGSRLAIPLADEFDAVDAWQTLAGEYPVDLMVCVSAGERRGIIGEEQAQEHAIISANLHPRFRIAGLGALHDASLQADRTVTFK